MKKKRPWYETHPRELWNGEDLSLAIRDGYKLPTIASTKKLDDLPIAQPAHLAPTWSPYRTPKRVGTTAQGRAIHQLLFDLGIRGEL